MRSANAVAYSQQHHNRAMVLRTSQKVCQTPFVWGIEALRVEGEKERLAGAVAQVAITAVVTAVAIRAIDLGDRSRIGSKRSRGMT